MWNLIKKDFKVFFQNKKIIMLIAIVSIILIIGTCCSKKEIQQENVFDVSNGIHIGVVDLDGSFYSKMLISYFENDEAFKMYGKISKGTKEEIEQLFQKGELHGYLILPENFAENLLGLKSSPVVSKINTKDMFVAVIFKNMLQSYEKYVYAVEVHAVGLLEYMNQKNMDEKVVSESNFQISKDLIFMILEREKFFEKKVEKTMQDIPTGDYYFQAFMAIFFLFSGVYGGYQHLKEKESGILKRLKITQLTGIKYFFSKWISTGIILTGISMFICFIRSFFLGNYQVFEKWYLYLIAIFLSIFLGLLISCFTKEIRIYFVFINNLYFFMCLVGGALIPIMYLPTNLMMIGRVTPVYWFMQMFL